MMAGPLADALFWIAVIATAIAHVFILRSTIRGMRLDTARARSVWEWVWAFLPALSLVFLFAYTWHAMHPESMSFVFPAGRPPIGSVSS